MQIYPAIDLLSGRAVRLLQGDFAQQSDYGDPLQVAHQYQKSGANYVHLVDLDAARSGQTSQETELIVRKILEETDLQVEVGGGVRDEKSVERWLNMGVWRCILGTKAAEEPWFAKEMVKIYGEAVIVGIDARDGVVATRGWEQASELIATEFAQMLSEFGYTECIFTDIVRDGTLQGANILQSVELAQYSGLRVIVSGGVKDIEDVRLVKGKESAGICGIVTGKAVLSGALNLEEALKIAKGV